MGCVGRIVTAEQLKAILRESMRMDPPPKSPAAPVQPSTPQ
jgi:hypothetical protein